MSSKWTIEELARVGDDLRVLFKHWRHHDERGWEYADQEMRLCTLDEIHGIQHVFGLEHEHPDIGGSPYEEFIAIAEDIARAEAAGLEVVGSESESEEELTTTLGAITRQLRPRDDDGDVKDL